MCPLLPATILVAASEFQTLQEPGGAWRKRGGSLLWTGLGKQATGSVATVAFYYALQTTREQLTVIPSLILSCLELFSLQGWDLAFFSLLYYNCSLMTT